ncbi:MAG: hypothetical protein AMJ79_01365 [Phycisphaerae bacterium SM23_30]|nr:MAG: hypothetical protein AMJ79_01365 [Phycisphaerae bacterium SM23_30]
MNKDKMFIIITGALIGLLSVLLVQWGNPPNMGFCIACFERDIAGALGLHQARTLQYIRPEIIGLVLGSFAAALILGKFKAEGGSSPLIRFILGMMVMVGTLVFLGCSTRMVLRLAGGDLNALLGSAGFLCGVLMGAFFSKTGSNPNAAVKQPTMNGWILPILMVVLLALLLGAKYSSVGENGPVYFSQTGPGAMQAPIIVALAAGLIAGFAMQPTRLCFVGGFLNIFRGKNPYLTFALIAVFLAALIGNLVTGAFSLGFKPQPIAHTIHLWNFLSMVLVGLGSFMLGGCPMRQLILTGQGNTDSAISVLGMIIGAALAHNLGLAASPQGVPIQSKFAVIVSLIICCSIALVNRKKTDSYSILKL